MQLGVHGCYVWGQGLPKGGIHFGTLSRVTEKGGWHTAYVVQDVLDWLRSKGYLKECTNLVFWSDGGSSYKSKVMCSFVGYHWLQRYRRIDNAFITHQKFGEPHHLKGALDRWFGQVDRRIRAAEVQKPIRTIYDALEAISVKRTTTREVVKILLPRIKRADWIAEHKLMKASTLPAKIRSTNYYSWRVTDNRVTSLTSKDGSRLTGVRASSHGVPGLTMDPSTTKLRDSAVVLEAPKARKATRRKLSQEDKVSDIKAKHAELLSGNPENVKLQEFGTSLTALLEQLDPPMAAPPATIPAAQAMPTERDTEEEKPEEDENEEKEEDDDTDEDEEKEEDDGAKSEDTGASGTDQEFDPRTGNQVLHDKTKYWMGWKCSYRKNKPELCSKKRAVRQLRARAELLGQYIVKLPDAGRKMEWRPDPDAHERHRARAKARRAEDKAFRLARNGESEDSLDESKDSAPPPPGNSESSAPPPLGNSESVDSAEPENSSSTPSSASGSNESGRKNQFFRTMGTNSGRTKAYITRGKAFGKVS